MGGNRIKYNNVRNMVKDYLRQKKDYAREVVDLLAMIFAVVKEIEEERRNDEADRKDADSRLHEAGEDK